MKGINVSEDTYSLEDFINSKAVSEISYDDFCVYANYEGMSVITDCLLDEFRKEIKGMCKSVYLDDNEYFKFKQRPKLLSNYVYGTTQLDYIILYANDMIDAREFTGRRFLMPPKSVIRDLISYIYSTQKELIEMNKENFER